MAEICPRFASPAINCRTVARCHFHWRESSEMVAKEKASYYWMEEGLTGQYYEWIDKQKLKGDLKQYFIQDYVLWMTKESEGVQRLDKEVRGIFWRNIPFPQSLKDVLKTRSLVYDDLCILKEELVKDGQRHM